MKFTEQLRQKANYYWEESFQHPFVQGIVKGDLELEKFRFYIIQDTYYLRHFARIQAIAASKATDLNMTARLAFHASATGEAETSLHESYYNDLFITKMDIDKESPAPTAYAYTSHMYRVALNGTVGEMIAVLLPCYWLYGEIGERFKDEKPEVEVFAKWIDTYSSSWFQELVEEQIHRLDELAALASVEEKERMTEHFLISSQYELAFWEMAFTSEEWPMNQMRRGVRA
ncbi:thiaminase [Bacillus coahuilensis m2-6]|uniref:Aminopyrimidine aminohydrolase n=1 Tax=Bacillus coahuilensis p1.1.43 TaxID=1150625 RepID=A0A147K9T4_9BACI|nr:thiaminase II [Bacillus coahuilensis]KUP07192.1 thiaminase [Bacillus coahuilensis p1.1.43]KUP08327.1 thiaminase [Bacillus coahuilensis m2-6]